MLITELLFSCIPFSTAKVEHFFSALKIIKTEKTSAAPLSMTCLKSTQNVPPLVTFLQTQQWISSGMIPHLEEELTENLKKSIEDGMEVPHMHLVILKNLN